MLSRAASNLDISFVGQRAATFLQPDPLYIGQQHIVTATTFFADRSNTFSQPQLSYRGKQHIVTAEALIQRRATHSYNCRFHIEDSNTLFQSELLYRW